MTDPATSASVAPTCPQCGAPVSLPGYADLAICAFCGSTLAREHPQSLEAAPDERPEEQTLRSVQCSQCAGPLSAREGKRVLVCAHCGVRVAVLEHGGLSHWYFPARVDRSAATAAGTAWLRDYPGVAEEARDARLVEARLVYAPIWEHKALVAGWEFGFTERARVRAARLPLTDETDETLQLEMVREQVQEARLQERRFYLPAADFDALGARRPRVTGRELLVPLLAGELDPAAIVVTPRGDVSEVVIGGRSAAQQPLSGALRPETHMFLFREAAALLYYPMWSLRYRQGDRYCHIVVDGRDGTVNRGVAPADQRKSVAILVARIVALMVLAAALVYLGATMERLRVPLVVAAVIVSMAATVLGFRFRAEKEVEYHEPFSG